jgi:hypothetical protein
MESLQQETGPKKQNSLFLKKNKFFRRDKSIPPLGQKRDKRNFGYIYPVFCLNTQPSCVKAITGETIAFKDGSSIQKFRLPG